MHTGIISRSAALKVLQPYLTDLTTCVHEGWAMFQAKWAGDVPVAWPGSKATMVHELVLEQVRRRLGKHPALYIKERTHKSRFLVYVKRKVAIQFKKLGPDFLTCNYPTETALRFDRQEIDIPECEPYPKLTVGYQLNEFATELRGVFVALRFGKQCVWWHNLDTGECSLELAFPTPDKLPLERKEIAKGDEDASASGA